ncbi:MAG: hypothetical protein SchgKO_05910 [Schleiferiaceae bacterium]
MEFIAYIPIITTLFAIYFTAEIYKHYKKHPTQYLLWWTLGVITFGLGTLSESVHALFGWQLFNLKFWYILGALLGGFPLAQGSVYLLMPKKFAKASTYIFMTLIVIASIAVIMTPVSIPEGFDYHLTGKVFEWKWVRYFSPFINLYAFIFLVGGAIYSAWRYSKYPEHRVRYKGNIFIAIGGLLPGIGGTFTRMGYVEVLFVTELLGLLLIYYGYLIIRNRKG